MMKLNIFVPILCYDYKDKTQRSNSVDQTFVMIFPKRNPSAQQESMRKCCRKIFSLIGVLPIKNKTKQALLDNAGYWVKSYSRNCCMLWSWAEIRNFQKNLHKNCRIINQFCNINRNQFILMKKGQVLVVCSEWSSVWSMHYSCTG